MSLPLVALIPTHHRFDLLAGAMDSLEDVPIILVDDSPEGDLPPELVSQSLDVLRTPGEVGFSRAVNLGLDRAEELGAEWILLLNDDAVMASGAVSALWSARSAETGVLAPILVQPDGREQAGFHIRSWGRVSGRRYRGASGDPDAVSGACMLLRSSERLDAAFPHGMEDFELCQRIRARGDRIRLVEAARCHHRGGATLSPRSRAGQRHGVHGHLRLMGGGWRSPVVVGLAVAQVVVERGPTERFKGIWEGWCDWRS
jgi:GT2 family glycosyltransferase